MSNSPISGLIVEEIDDEEDIKQNEARLMMNEIIETTVRSIMCHQRATGNNSYKNSEITALIPEFGGHEDDVEGWLQRIDAIQVVYKVPDEVMQLISIGKLTDQARSWFNTKIEYVTMSWNDLKREMLTMFNSRPNKVVLMKKMEVRKWKKTENFSNYFTDKVMLCNKIGMSDSDIIDYVIDGFDNPVLQSQARTKNFKNTSDVLVTMKSVTNEDRGARYSDHGKDTYQHPFKFKENVPSTNNTTTGTVKKDMHCYNCNILGHRATECTKPRREPGSCFECGSKDHIFKIWPKWVIK